MLGEERLYDAMCNAANVEAKKTIIKDAAIGIVDDINPIKIIYESIPLVERNLIIDKNLLPHTVYFSNLSGTTGGTSFNISDGSFLVPDALHKGDKVALIELNNGKYYVAGKV